MIYINHVVHQYVELLAAYHQETFKHSLRVSDIALFLGKWHGVLGEELTNLYYSALLHDVGKVLISITILDKPCSLTPEEWDEIKKHPLYGANLVHDRQDLTPYLDGIIYHHERWDGKGYPFALREHQIPLRGRIIAAADATDAMIFGRPYKDSLSVEEAISELMENEGSQFDPAIADLFLEKEVRNYLTDYQKQLSHNMLLNRVVNQ